MTQDSILCYCVDGGWMQGLGGGVEMDGLIGGDTIL